MTIMTMLTFLHSGKASATRRKSGLRSLVSFVGFVLLLASIIRELRLPAAERSWHGRVFGRVPYDLRFPSPSRLASTMWNPAEHRLLVPTAFGVGWTVNLGALWAAAHPD
jgi:uncharacterized protein DUF5808